MGLKLIPIGELFATLIFRFADCETLRMLTAFENINVAKVNFTQINVGLIKVSKVSKNRCTVTKHGIRG